MKSVSDKKVEKKGTLGRIISKTTQVFSSKTTFFILKKRNKFYIYFVKKL